MKKLSGLLLLLVLLFSVTTALSADGLEPSNLFMQGTMETTISQKLGGVVVLQYSERLAVPVESIIQADYFGITMVFLYGTSNQYINYENGKWFVHPAVLGIC